MCFGALKTNILQWNDTLLPQNIPSAWQRKTVDFFLKKKTSEKTLELASVRTHLWIICMHQNEINFVIFADFAANEMLWAVNFPDFISPKLFQMSNAQIIFRHRVCSSVPFHWMGTTSHRRGFMYVMCFDSIRCKMTASLYIYWLC